MLEEDKEVVYESKYTWNGKPFRVIKAEVLDGFRYFTEVYKRDRWGVLHWEVQSRFEDLNDAVFSLGYTAGIYVMSER